MNSIDEYINNFEGIQKEWFITFATFMRETFPDSEEVISYQMPTYKFNGQFIGFSVAKEHFSFHTIDFEMIEELKTQLPKAKFGRGCAKVKFTDKDAIPILFKMAKKIVDRSKANPPKKKASKKKNM
jgi:uncharacterized protein YdhG (YjbR/CyaY superfamily)